MDENEMNAKSLYMRDVIDELFRLKSDDIKQIHDSIATDICLPRLSVSDNILVLLGNHWNKDVHLPNRGYYKPYIEQTIIRFAQNRQFWKTNYSI